MGSLEKPPHDPVWPQVDIELLKGLPPIHRAVVRALGIARAGKFLTEYGGVTQHIPKFKPTAFGLTADELDRLRIALAAHLDYEKNGKIDLPKPDKVFRQARNLQIRKERESCSIRNVAHTYSLTSRQIKNITREEDQLDLF